MIHTLKLTQWSSQLDLKDFYVNAAKRGYANNASRHMLIDSLAKEHQYAVWIFYYNDQAVGSVAAHSLDIFDKPSYRILARTCCFTDLLPMRTLRTMQGITSHQNYTAQYYLPTCIEWADSDADLYITSNDSDVAAQRAVHNIYCPALAKTGCLEKTCEIEYRGHIQTFWQLNRSVFYEQLNALPRWC